MKIITFKTNRIKEIPCIGCGTYGQSEDQLRRLLTDYSFDNLLIDTAERYGNEQDVGLCLRESGIKRSCLFVIAKISYNQQTVNNAEISLSSTLNNLQLDYVDLYLIHSPRHKNTLTTWMQMLELKRSGLTAEIGVSNFSSSQIEMLYRKSGVYPAVNQIVLHTMSTDEQNEIITYCSERDILIQAAQPFGGAFKEYTFDYCKRILKNNYHKHFISIVGTANRQHLYDDFSIFMEKNR